MREKIEIKLNKETGITLIALIITIIVLVIFAAVSIRAVYNMGIVDYAINGTQNYARAAVAENRMFDSVVAFTERAKITGFAEAEAYSVLLARPDLSNNQASLAALTVARLREEGYDVRDITTVTEAITEVNLSSDSVTLNVGDQYASIDVTYQNSNTSNTKYYIQILGKYYELTITKSGTTIGQEVVDVDSLETNITGENELTASSANTSIATVEVVGNETVKINGITKGSTTVTVSNAGITKTVNVTITNNIKNVTITGATAVNVGENITLMASIAPAGAEGNLTWTSQNGRVTIATSGTQNTTATVTGSSEGNDVIIVRNSQNVQVGSYEIQVTNYIQIVTISSGDESVQSGETIPLTVTINPPLSKGTINIDQHSGNGTVTISPSQIVFNGTTSEATVNVTGDSEGTVTIDAYMSGTDTAYTDFTISVVAATPAAKDISFTVGNIQYKAYEGETWGEWLARNAAEVSLDHYEGTPFGTAWIDGWKTYSGSEIYALWGDGGDYAIMGTEVSSGNDPLSKYIGEDAVYSIYLPVTDEVSVNSSGATVTPADLPLNTLYSFLQR